MGMGGPRHGLATLSTVVINEWASGPAWTGAEILAPPAFDPRAIKLVASCYAD